jgi:hypothetical protein
MPSDSNGLGIHHFHRAALCIARELTATVLHEGEIGGTVETLASSYRLTCAGTHS